MCNGIAVLVYEKDEELKGLCTGISSHDELCKLDEDLRYGKTEPWRFELLYPNNLVFDRGYNTSMETGLFKEQPPQKIWDMAFEVSNIFRMKHTKKQLQKAYLTEAYLAGADLTRANLAGADLTRANLAGAYLTEANLTEANLAGAYLTEANLTEANLTRANLTGADLIGAYYDKNTTGLNDTQEAVMTKMRSN